jgi:hypothetical protein
MTLIHVPRIDPKTAMDRNRPVNSLLKVQIEHLHEAETKLPIGHRTDIYINAIKNEGDAGEYIRRVTEAIHAAHGEAAAKRTRPAGKRRGVIEIAAVAEERPLRKRSGAANQKKNKGKGRPKK